MFSLPVYLMHTVRMYVRTHCTNFLSLFDLHDTYVNRNNTGVVVNSFSDFYGLKLMFVNDVIWYYRRDLTYVRTYGIMKLMNKKSTNKIL